MKLRSVTRTFAFIDIVGSTSLIDAIGDWAWVELLSWHERTLGTLFELHGGELVDQAGDGFFVAFAESAAAIDCAIAIQRIVARHRHGNGFALNLRIGLHRAGVLGCGSAYRGKGVHVTARIARLASGGEILASREAMEASGTGVATSASHAVELAGISEAVHVQLIQWELDATSAFERQNSQNTASRPEAGTSKTPRVLHGVGTGTLVHGGCGEVRSL